MPQMLVVDDEPKLCDCLKGHFEAKGFRVACAYSGAEAVDWLMEHPVDVMLLDIRLPDMLGIEVLKRARELRPEAKVVMVTALADEDHAIEAKVYGACGYVTKPFDFSDLTWQAVFPPN